MRLGALAFLAGMLFFHVLAELPARGWAWVLPVAVLIILKVPRLRLAAAAAAGFLWPLLWAEPPLELPAALEGADLQLTGWVASIPETAPRYTRFELQVESLASAEEAAIPFAGRVQLNWYDSAPSLQVGDRWALTVRLRRPRGLLNPGAFDYERWLFVNGIRARGYVRGTGRLLARAERYPVDRFRQALAERFARLLADNPYTGILIALAVGDRQGIGSEQWEVFTRTGTGHLMAISGLHVGLVAGLAFLLIRRGWARFPALALRWPAPKAAALAAILAAGGYALLAGLSVPTQRALVMVTVAMAALLWQRPVIPSRILALALLAVLLADPFAPLAGGFWLSFAAVAAILYAVTGRGSGVSLGRWVWLQLVVLLALLPATLGLFQSLSLISPLANLIAIPWASATVVPLTLLAVLASTVGETLQAVLLWLAALAMDWLWAFLIWLDRWSWASVPLPAPPLWTVAFAVPGLLLLLGPRGLPGRWLGTLLCLPLLCFPRPTPAPGAVWFTLLEVGTGLAAVVRTTNHVLVYDTGPWRGFGFDTGRIALVPFLDRQGVRRIDALIVSHADNAHRGGTRSLLERFPVERILTSSPREVPIERARLCRAGEEWIWDGVRFQLLHPPPDGAFSGDDASCVLLVESRGRRVLLPGDVETAAQQNLVRRWGSELAADILVAPHHGTRSLLAPAFLAAVRPRHVLFSTGYGNPYGYPRPETLSPYREAGAVILDTAEEGAITFRLEEGNEPVPESYRRQSRRYWHTP